MTKFVVALIVVAAVLASGLMALLRARSMPLPPKDVLDRVRQREKELEALNRRAAQSGDPPEPPGD